MNNTAIATIKMNSLFKSTKKCPYTLDKNGKVEKSLSNIRIFLDTTYPNAFKYNEFTSTCNFNGKDWDEDFDLPVIHNKLIETLNISAKLLLKDIIIQKFVENSYNPMKDWLNSLKWDGFPRLEKIFSYFLGAEDTPLLRDMTKKWFVAAVKRVFEPGCKFDNIIILQGPQGCGKSFIFEQLSPSFARPASIDDISNTKDAVSTMNKSWIVTFDELSTLNKKDMNAVKTFLSKQSDTVRLAYARNDKEFKRKCIFVGSTNESTFLRDYTSSVERRFWIIKCTFEMGRTRIKEFNRGTAEQMWAEAMHIYRSNPDMYLDLDLDSTISLSKTQKEFKTSEEDGYVDQLKAIVYRKYQLNNDGEFISEAAFANQFQTPASATGTNAKYFTKIPISWVNNLVRSTIGEKRAHTYIKSVLADDFDYAKRCYNGIRTMCLVRKNSVKDFKDLV